MASDILLIPRVSDKTLLSCLKDIEKACENVSSPVNFQILGQVNTNSLPSAFGEDKVLANLSKKNSYLITYFSWNINGLNIRFFRGGNTTEKSPYTDQITLDLDQRNLRIDDALRIEISALLIQKLKAFDHGRSVGATRSKEEEALFSIHEANLQRLEQLNEDLTVKNHEFSNKLREDQEDHKRQLDESHQNRLEELEAEFKSKSEKLESERTAFAEKVKEHDAKSNTHARRQIRQDIIKEIKDRQTTFNLTVGTNKLRTPIMIAMLVLISIFVVLAVMTAVEFYDVVSKGSNTLLIAVSSIKQLVYSFGAIASTLYYIKWQNRWFEQHSTAEFHLKQLELDMERASWLVETSLEWNDAKGDTIPTELLESLSRNLFSNSQDDIEKVVHPADELASAILGSSSMVKLKAGNAELQIDPQKLKKSKKEIPVGSD